MNIIEKADKYADGKANEAITNAIAQAYIDGYRDGYRDREQEVPADFRDNKTEYIDLGLPSRTLWSSDYEKDGDSYLYLPYERAEYLKIPTKEQWEELCSSCRWEYVIDNSYDFCKVKCIGPNGNVIIFNRTGKINSDQQVNGWEAFFWLEETNQEDLTRNCVHMWNDGKRLTDPYKRGRIAIEKCYLGYKLRVRLVR